MSTKQAGPRYIFRGNAMPFGARIEAVNEKPHYELIKGPPAAALPVVGGWSIGTSSGSCCHDSFKWGATLADCKGEWKGENSFVSTVTSSIADVYIKNDPHVFEASLIRLRIVSEDDGPSGQPRMFPTETVFEGMRLDNQPITVTLTDVLTQYPTFDEFKQEYQTKYQSDRKPPQTAGEYGGNSGGYIAVTFVSEVAWNGQTFPGNVLSLKGFGNIYFGEALVAEYNRHVTMVRLELGCAMQASASVSSGDPGGTWTP